MNKYWLYEAVYLLQYKTIIFCNAVSVIQFNLSNIFDVL